MLAPYLMRRSNRPQGLRAMTVGPGVITDFYRGQRVAGGYPDDGLAVPGGFGVYPASNAAVVDATLNGNFETNTAGWTNHDAGGVISRITTDAKFGSACLQTVNDGTGANQGPITAILTGLTPGNVYTGHLWIKSVSGATALQFQIDWLTVGVAYIGSSIVTLTATGAWQHVILTATAPALGTDAVVMIINTAATAATYNIDGVQLDNGPVALPFDPANTRVAGRIRVPIAGLLTVTQGWVAACITSGGAPANFTTNCYLFSLADDGNNIIAGYLSAANPSALAIQRFSGGAGSTFGAQTVAVPAAGQRILGVCAWVAGFIRTALNGADFTEGANTDIPTLAATAMEVFENQVGALSHLKGSGNWAVLGAGVLTNADSVLMETWRAAGAVPTLDQIAMLSHASQPTCLIPAKTQDAILLPAYFEGAH